MKEYLKSKEEVISEQKTTMEGLAVSEAERRLEENGKNKLVE